MRRQSEKEYMEAIKQLAHLHHWKVYHTFDSRRSDPGFPDLVLARRGQMIFCEVKSEKGKLTPAQQEWIESLRCVEARAEAILRTALQATTAPFLIRVFEWHRETDTLDRLAEILA